MVNLDVGGYTKTLNHRKIRKTQKKHRTENQKNTKTGSPFCLPPSVACWLRVKVILHKDRYFFSPSRLSVTHRVGHH